MASASLRRDEATSSHPSSLHRVRVGVMSEAWWGAALLCTYGVLTRNPAAIVVAQAWWLSSTLAGEGPRWRWLPTSALCLVTAHLVGGEIAWALAKVAAPTTAVAPTLVVVTTIVCLASAAIVHPPTGRRSGPAGWAVGLAVGTVFFPALRPGSDIGTATYALASSDLMHNMSRAARVQDLGYIPYGLLSPTASLTGDYYPRGFHQWTAHLSAAVDLAAGASTELWSLGFARMFWLVWALVLVALAAWAVRLQETRSAEHSTRALAVVAGPALLLLPPVFRAVIGPGFPSFALALLAVVVMLDRLSSGGGWAQQLLTSGAAVAVISHAWPALLVVPMLAAMVLLARRIGRRQALAGSGALDGSGLRWVTVLVGGALAAASLRPWVTTLFSGDAAEQARENGSLNAVPLVVGIAWALGVVLWFSSRPTWVQATVTAAALAAAVMLEVIALIPVDWQWNYYYPKKVGWAGVIVLLPVVAVGTLHWFQVVVTAIRRRLTTAATLPTWSSAAVLVIAMLSSKSAVPLLMNKPFLDPRIADLASEALGRSDVQIVAYRFMSQESDYAATRWGHIGLELHGVPAFNFSDIDAGELSLSELCGSPGLNRQLLVYTPTAQDGSIRCGRVAW